MTIKTKPPKYTVSFANKKGRTISVVAGTKSIWEFSFSCGSREILPGGKIAIFCEVPKFWLAVIPQKENKEKKGYFRVKAGKGINAQLGEISSHYKQLTWAVINLPQGLKPGEKIIFCAGTKNHPLYAIAHQYHRVLISLEVNYEGNGEFVKLWPPLRIDVIPGKINRLVAIAPSIVRPNEKFDIKIRGEDKNSNIGSVLDGEIVIALVRNGSVLKKRKEKLNRTEVKVSSGWKITEEGIYGIKITSSTDPSLKIKSNPFRCEEKKERIFWGDCHNHTGWADGIGALEDNLLYAKEKAFLDVFGLAEHIKVKGGYRSPVVNKKGSDSIYLGMEMEDISRRFYKPGKFVTILGCEYTPSAGDYKGPTGDHCIFSPSANWSDMPLLPELGDLFAMASRHGCLVIPHVGGRIPPVKEIKYDEKVTPLIEIASMHGHFEWFAQEALSKGCKFGFCGMSDGHYGMPGYDNWALHGRTEGLKRRNFSVQSPLTAFIVKRLTREDIFKAMRERKTYVTTGERILLSFEISGIPMGSCGTCKEFPVVKISVYGTSLIKRIDIIRGEQRVYLDDKIDKKNLSLEWIDEYPLEKEVPYYVRIYQEDFSLAWSSPVWIRYRGERGRYKRYPSWNSPPYWPYPKPETCSKTHLKALERILKERRIKGRFNKLKEVGVFEDNRGKFSFFRGDDGMLDCPVHIQHYFEFEDERLYIAKGWSDYGEYRE